MMFSFAVLVLLCARLVSPGPHHMGEKNASARRCRDITDIEELCQHKKQCIDVMPDLPKLCQSFKKEKYGVEEFVEIIDERRSDIYTIQELAGMIPYADASPPIIIQGPINVTVAPGSQYQLECKAEGAPTPKLTITRRSEASMKRVASSTKDLDVQLSAAQVIHKNERVQFSDQGWYRCVAANSRGVVYHDAYLRVYDLCQDVFCTGGKVCVPDNYAGTAECRCPECLTYEYAPLCGSDCVSHFNPCQLDYRNCMDGTAYTMFLDTDHCPDFTPPVFDSLPDPVQDVIEDKTIKLTCTAKPAGASPGPPPIISWYRAGEPEEQPSDEPTVYPTMAGPVDFDQKLGDGEVLKFKSGDSATIYCVAHQCKHGQNIPIDVVSDPIRMEVGPANLFVWPHPSCQIFGDPHIITFDGNSYEFGGQCEYVLAMDCEAKNWYIYGQFDACSTHGGRASCLSSVTLYYNSDIRIELQRGWVINNNGKRMEPTVGMRETITGDLGSTVTVEFDGALLVVVFNSAYRLSWDGLVSAQILLGEAQPKVCGLCGNVNKDPTDDHRVRYQNTVTDDVGAFGDSWRIDRLNKCQLLAGQPAWDWETEFAHRRDPAIEACNAMFAADQLAYCADGWEIYESAINPAPYKEACIADYMRSDWLEAMGLNPGCVAVGNYAERCGNKGNKNHLWREQTGCSGTDEELEAYNAFIFELGCEFK